MSTNAPKSVVGALPPGAKIAVIAARFNGEIVEELIRGCVARLVELNVIDSNIEVHRVPGAFELPLAARLAARTRKFDAVICLGCVIRGQTAHFEYVAGECARGIQQVMLDDALPVVFGVLTTENEDQARQRIGGSHGHAGISAAETAAEMVTLARELRA